jgi:hypothetical protein
MASQQMGYIGRIGNIIHYKMDGKFYTRAAPRKYKQTKATKAKSSEFGMASTIGCIIRQNLESVIFDTNDRKMQTRLVGEIFTWLQIARHEPASAETQPGFDHFQFSAGSPILANRWDVKFKVSSPLSGQIQIAIPSFIPKTSFKTPAGAGAVVCRIASVVIDVENKKELGSAQSEIIYQLDRNKTEAQNIIQELPMAKGSLLVTGMCLEYFVERSKRSVPTKDKLFKPSQIIYAVYN